MNAVTKEDVFLSCFRNQSLLTELSDEQIRHLALGSVLSTYSRGDVVCEKGCIPDGIFCLVEGKVKLAVLSAQGNERVVEIVTPGHSFGETMLFLNAPCPVYAEALCKCQVILLRKSKILEALQTFPEVGLAFLRAMSERQNRLMRDVEVCCLQSAGRRVAGFLLDNLCVDGATVHLPAGKAVVASKLNLTPETFSRELHSLAAENLISVDRRTIRVLDRQRLSKMILT
jgi:CRP-like cAMP-binding protein